MTWLKTVAAGLLIAATAGAAHAQVATKQQLTIEGARDHHGGGRRGREEPRGRRDHGGG